MTQQKEAMTTVGIEPSMIRIDDKEYDANALPEEARRLIMQLRMTDQELAHQQALLSMLNAARHLYATRLNELLPK